MKTWQKKKFPRFSRLQRMWHTWARYMLLSFKHRKTIFKTFDFNFSKLCIATFGLFRICSASSEEFWFSIFFQLRRHYDKGMALCGYAHFALGHHWSLIILMIISTTGCPKNALSESSSRSYNQSEPTSLACKLQAASQTLRCVSLQDDDSESAFFWDTLYNTWWNPGQLAVEEYSWAASDRLPITYHHIHQHHNCVYQHQCHSFNN